MVRLVATLLVLTFACPSFADDHGEWAGKAQGRVAYGRYIAGKKAGYVIEETKLGTHDGKDVLSVTSTEHMVTLSDGEKSRKDESTVSRYSLADGKLVYARLTRDENGSLTTIEAVRHGKGMRVSTRQGKDTTRRDVALPRDDLDSMRALETWLTSSKRKSGDRLIRHVLQLDGESIDREEVYVFGKKAGKGETPQFEVTIQSGGKWRAVVAADGRLIEGAMGFWSVRREKEDDAKDLGEPPDLQEASLISLDRDLGKTGEVDELILELRGAGDFRFPQSHRQTVKAEKNHVAIILKRDFAIEKAEPLTAEEVKAYTRSTPRFRSDHEAILKKAKAIVGEEKDAAKKARLIGRWVSTSMKDSDATLETAPEVLERMEGDCTEYALLFVALARASGVPAREVAGLAYVRHRGKPKLGWHAWAEVHDGRQWVGVDAMRGQYFVDAAHLKLGEGEDTAWANLVGEVAVKVVEVKQRR